ncbi:hypothetical protein L195_g011333 [Trifolium pratense]|uniref:Uncharacterized protein n=1 Tax=Trifolium pratense TaxID=57577 RepID=A0A2K3PH76_TRIPR|nr:hypothetical protein L195_g011333 [Trifolium pratense]
MRGWWPENGKFWPKGFLSNGNVTEKGLFSYSFSAICSRKTLQLLKAVACEKHRTKAKKHSD